MSERPEADRRILEDHSQTAQSWLAIEMRTRDQDAEGYLGFFTDFQNAAEMSAYSEALSGYPSVRALDIGCGTGRNTDTIVSESVVGIDLSRKELLLAQERMGNAVTFIQASATHLPFREGIFDMVLCAGVLQHIPGEDQRTQAIDEIGRVVLRPSRVVLGAHSYSWVVSRMFAKERVEHNLFWHRFTATELERLLRRSLDPCVVKAVGICHLPRWRVGNRLGRRGVWLDKLLSRLPAMKYLSGAILVARVDCT